MNKVELYVNGVQVDVKTDFSLRMNRQVADPSKINGGSAEYSFQFNLPSTPINNKVFGFANVLGVQGKFMKRYNAEVYALGSKIFNGDLMLTSYDSTEKEYTCNLVSIKVNTVDDIFGDMTLYDLEWYIPYNGSTTINSTNANASSEVYFPLVAYGVFEKDPVFSDEVADDYTDRMILDDTVRWYHETFYPSFNVLSLVKKLFEQKGYTLQGDVLDDEVLKNIYCSVSLANDQALDYNYGNPKLGSVDLSLDWCNRVSNLTWAARTIQELKYKYCKEVPYSWRSSMKNYSNNMPYQFEEIGIYNLFGDGATVTENTDSYLFDSGEQCIVIPADGFYKIDLNVTATLNTTFNSGKIKGLFKKWNYSGSYPTVEENEEEFNVGLNEMTPIEIQLVKNVLNDNNNIELIKGVHNRDWVEAAVSSGSRTNRDYDTCYPHEMLCWSRNPTSVEPPENSMNYIGSARTDVSYDFGYMPKSGEIFTYDPWVSENFICGFSTYLGATMAVQKNNGSWYRGQKDYVQGLYKNTGYTFLSGSTYTPTSKNANDYPDAPQSSVSVSGNTLTGHLYCSIWLNKNDILTLNCIHRNYNLDSSMSTSKNMYVTNVHADLKIDAFTPRDYSYVLTRGLGYNSPTQFDTNLRLGNFLSRERTAADFINNVIKEFNLNYRQSGKVVELNRSKIDVSANGKAVIDIDGRCSAKRAKWQRADYPREIGVKYSDEKDSWWYWLTVPSDKQNEYNWKEFGDPGYDIITIDPDSTSTNIISTNTSFTGYDTFTLKETNSETPLTMPVIGDYSVFAPGANYGDAMKNDCLDEKMRYWLRNNTATGKDVTLASTNETVNIYLPTDTYDGVTMNYKDSKGTLLKRYFNTDMDIRNEEVEVEVRLTPDEFVMLGNGADVKFDDCLYRVLSIDGYDPASKNTTTLTLMRI